MANTIPSTLVSEIVSEMALTTLGPVLGAVGAFSHTVAPDPVAPQTKIKVGISTATSAAVTNPTNYETGDTTQEQRDVTLNEVSKSFHVTQSELNKGHTLRSMIRKNMQTMANAARDIVFAPITEANYGAAVLDVTAANFVASDLQSLWAVCKDFPTKNLLIDGAYYAKLLPTNADSFRPGQSGAYGWDSIGYNNRWNGCQAGTIGFAGSMDALLIASGEPAMDSALLSQLDDYQEVPLDGGLTVFVAHWASTASRARWMSIGLMIGAAAGDKTSGRIIGDDVTAGGSVGES
jgi:hypothetical protein